MPDPLRLVDAILNIYGYLLILRIVISWVRINEYNPWIRLLVKLTEPYLEPFRSLFPPLAGIDFSPILAFLVLNMLRIVLIRLLAGF
jgi:YggT family protein